MVSPSRANCLRRHLPIMQTTLSLVLFAAHRSDLGYNDLGFTNNGKTHTPNIDEAVRNGIQLTAYHTYKVCSPTRASLM